MRDNPIGFREARAWKRPQRWLSLLLYPLLLIAPTLLASLTTRDGLQYQMHDAQRTAFQLTCLAHIFYMCVRGLLSTVTLIAAERERGTFDSLATTRTSVREVVRASLFWALWPRLAELVLFGPILFFLPGARWDSSPEAILGLLLLAFPCAAAYAALGLWLSAGQRRSAAAVALGLLTLVGNFFGLTLVELMVSDAAHVRSGGPWLSWLVNPLVDVVGLMGGHSERGPWYLGLLFHVGAACVLYRLCVERLSRPEVSRRRAVGARRWLLPRLSEDPVLYRELLLTSRSGLAWLLAYPVLVAGPYVLFAGFGWEAGYNHYPQLLLALSVHAAYMALRSIGAGLRAVALEREQRTWEPLLSTRLTGGQVLRGKLLAGMLPVLAPLVVFGPVWTLYIPAEQTAMMLAYSAMLALFLYSLALWLSLNGRSAAVVGLQVTGVLVALMFGTLAVDAVIRDSEWLLSQLSPIFATVCYLQEPQGFKPLLALGPYLAAIGALLWGCRRRLSPR